MPLRCEILASHSTLLIVATGTLNDEDLRRASEALLEDPALGQCSRGLGDFRGVTSNQLSAAGLRALAGLWNPGAHVPDWRVAIVSSRDVDFGTSRMYEAYMDDPTVSTRAFRDIEEAEHWLGLLEGFAADPTRND